MDEDFGMHIDVITIILDPLDNAPRIDLGRVPPHIALAIFLKAAEALEGAIPYPTISYENMIIASDMYIGEEFDED